MIRLNDLSISLDADDEQILSAALRKSGIRQSDIIRWRLSRKSVDARDKERIHFVCSVDLEARGDEEALARRSLWKKTSVEEEIVPVSFREIPRHGRAPLDSPPPVVVGTGPAGLFAALALSEAGLAPIVIERGRPVSRRMADVQKFFSSGILDPSSNVQFGEGGAGTFSDGKLNTGIKKDAFTARVLQVFAESGAPEKILWEARPHVGTDLLAGVVTAIRRRIENSGSKFLFETTLVGLRSQNGALTGVEIEETSSGIVQRRILETRSCFLCIGHSARDTFAMLAKAGLPMEQKPFSIGVRIEHPQRLINESQYGRRFAAHPALGAADYRLALHLPNGRGVYTFCMCPGGHVVAAASEEGMTVTNGMSTFARDGKNANSALLVGLTPEDFGNASSVLAGVEFQRRFERLAFELGGSGYAAPAARVGDFLRSLPSKKLGAVEASYRPGVTPGDISKALPPFAADALRQALPILDRRLKGFAHPDAVMTAVETRSSSPVRILRGKDFQSTGMRGLYPCGEGAGYAGGIMSSAADGLRAAAACLCCDPGASWS